LSPRRLLFGAGGLAAILLVGFSVLHLRAAASAAQRGKAALSRAESALSARSLGAARSDLRDAEAAFTAAQEEIEALGPVASVARRIPVVRDQMRAVDTFAHAGLSLSQAAQPLVDAADTLINPVDEATPVSAAMDALRSTQASLAPAVAAISQASDNVVQLKGTFLLGPLASARDDLVARLPRIKARAVSAGDGLRALMAFAGDSGPRRYLFLSQNPDEIRPTGGFIGTYGVLTADHGQLRLDRYDAIENWTGSHPDVSVPAEDAGSPFRFHSPPLRRTLSNVNSVPDWPQAAELAANLWKAAGEPPVDGVISFTPGFMRRVLSVIGAVEVAAFGETVTAENMNERLDFHTHQTPPAEGTGRKDFVAALAEVVMQALLQAPASKWEPLGQVMGEAFDAREAMAWSSDPVVAGVLADRSWDGAFPAHRGDFFFNAEFAYITKNGRGIRRVYDHHVELRPDGGARVTTELTLTNTLPPHPLYNASSLAYMTVYGPEGAVLDQGASDPFGFPEPAIAGHPATGWFKAAGPAGGQVTLKVVWDVPSLLELGGDSEWAYNLRWMHVPDHTGDIVNLTVALPPAWRWDGGPPPGQFSLDQEFAGTWKLVEG
jgi:hypothetical protein